MRRALLKRLPALTKFYPGLMPWHLERMTLSEVTEYVRQMEQSTGGT